MSPPTFPTGSGGSGRTPSIPELSLGLRDLTVVVQGIQDKIPDNLNNRLTSTEERLERIEDVIGETEKPGKFATDKPTPGRGVAGAVETLVRQSNQQRLLKTTAATQGAKTGAKTGTVTAAVIIIVIKIAELFFSMKQHNNIERPKEPASLGELGMRNIDFLEMVGCVPIGQVGADDIGSQFTQGSVPHGSAPQANPNDGQSIIGQIDDLFSGPAPTMNGPNSADTPDGTVPTGLQDPMQQALGDVKAIGDQAIADDTAPVMDPTFPTSIPVTPNVPATPKKKNSAALLTGGLAAGALLYYAFK